ncbi:30761_t:CDS:2, partial [Racocetra persica]
MKEESQNASEENETDIPDRKDRSKKPKLATYCTCLVLNDLGKNCDAQLKIVG